MEILQRLAHEEGYCVVVVTHDTVSYTHLMTR